VQTLLVSQRNAHFGNKVPASVTVTSRSNSPDPGVECSILRQESRPERRHFPVTSQKPVSGQPIRVDSSVAISAFIGTNLKTQATSEEFRRLSAADFPETTSGRERLPVSRNTGAITRLTSRNVSFANYAPRCRWPLQATLLEQISSSAPPGFLRTRALITTTCHS
jgi:hypothetical protein